MKGKNRFKKLYFLLFLIFIIGAIFLWIFFSKPLPLFQGKLNLDWLKDNSVEKQASFQFAVVGDNHNNLEIYQKIIQRINQDKMAFFVDLGDLTRVGASSEYYEAKRILDQLKVPYYMTMGDHDKIGNGYDLWQQYFGPTYYSWDFKNGHFVILNDVVNENGFSEEQLNWLENDLSRTNKEVKIIFLHRPPRCPFAEPGDLGFTGPYSQERITRFFNIAQRYRINKIFAGHLHNFLNYSVEGIPITVTGGGGGPIYHIPLIGKNRHHFLEIEIIGSQIEQKVIEL